MIAPMLAVVLTGAAFSKAPNAPEKGTSVAVYSVEGWRLRVVRDPFAGTTTCELHNHGARIERGRLVWSLGALVPTTYAVYRIDGGPPHVQSSRSLPASANMTNPSNGAVVIPVEEIGVGSWVEVRPRPGAGVRRLPVSGLDRALAQAAQAGCARPANAPGAAPIS